MFKILIFGAGSVGTCLGTQLYAAGHDVSLYGGRKLKALTSQLVINGTAYALPPKLTQLDMLPYNLILVTTKLPAVPEAIKQLHQALLNPQVIGFVQNGLVERQLYSDFADHPGFITLSLFNGYRLAHDQMQVEESGLGIQVENSSTGRKICDLFQSSGIRCQLTDDIDSVRAKKLILNAALNSLSALERKPMAALVQDSRLQGLLQHIVQEGWSVLHSDYSLPSPEVIMHQVYQTALQVPDHYSSTYQDVVSKRPTEIDFLNGYIAKLGQKKGIPTPYNQEITQRIKALERHPLKTKTIKEKTTEKRPSKNDLSIKHQL